MAHYRVLLGLESDVSGPSYSKGRADYNFSSCDSREYPLMPLAVVLAGTTLRTRPSQCIRSPNAAIGVRDLCPVYSSNGVRPELATLTLLRRAAAHQAHHVHMGLLGLNSLPSSYSRCSFSVRSWPCQVLTALSLATLHLESVFYWRFHWHSRGGPPGGHF